MPRLRAGWSVHDIVVSERGCRVGPGGPDRDVMCGVGRGAEPTGKPDVTRPADTPSAVPLVTAHSEINIPFTDTSALASNVAPHANAILGFLADSSPTVTSSRREGLL